MVEFHSLPADELDRFVQRSKASSALPDAPNMASVLEHILEKASELVPSAAGAVLLDDPLAKTTRADKNDLHFVAAFGPTAADVIGRSLRAGEAVAGHVYVTGTAHLVTDTGDEGTPAAEVDALTGYAARSVIAAPILIGDAVCGAIELVNRLDGKPYDAHDMLMLEVFASYTASSIRNALDARAAQELAKRDDLTGLYNDRYLHVRLQEEIERAAAEGGPCALLFIDLDHFKPVNDTYGHLVGSQVLREVGYVIRRATADEDAIAARYGGDEFTVVLPGRDAEAAAVVGERIRRAIATQTYLEKNRGPHLPALRLQGMVTASIGVADIDRLDAPVETATRTLLRRADRAMYAAKASGKDRVVRAGAASGSESESPLAAGPGPS
jgi:diguanylate cyclase (GGDEF)-like protein